MKLDTAVPARTAARVPRGAAPAAHLQYRIPSFAV